MKEDARKSKSLSFKYTPNYSEIKKTEFKANHVCQRPKQEEYLGNYEEVFYQPKTDETRAAYDEFLNLIRQPLAGQPLSTLGFVAYIIVEILKNETGSKYPWNKRKHIDLILNPISDHVFDQLLSISKLLTDFHDDNVSSSSSPHGNSELNLLT
ncbi:putative RNA helicase [Medicago truncatula]|uniref:Putative RNA helicase n=1 Tax=Medicago truncatula TaxID=3880 RepID=G7IMK5_MEDTR|nr:U5 small nuclear ribonucleoprotein helicase [Medicago truncatula]RHN72914.1 putative RNA helicase [Medicago truncatula]